MNDWLILDIGNSGLKAATFDGSQIVHRVGIAGHGRAQLQELEGFARAHPASRAAMSSVVPSVGLEICGLIEGLTPGKPMAVGPDLELPFRMDYQTPKTLGADRISAAAAACRWLGELGLGTRALGVVDAGTAVTIEIVESTRKGPVYRGGSIGPGPDLLRRALGDGTAQLPLIDLVLPRSVIGRSTSECMQVGVMAGFVETVRGLVRRVTSEMDADIPFLLTGGWAAFLAANMEGVYQVEPDLVLRGVRDIAELNQAR